MAFDDEGEDDTRAAIPSSAATPAATDTITQNGTRPSSDASPIGYDDDDGDDNRPPTGASTGRGGQGNENGDDDDEEGADFKLFLSLFDRRGRAAQALRRGEKDFESHGTRAQEFVLEASRQVLEEALSEVRIHPAQSWVRGWYFPNAWTLDDEIEDDEGGDPAEHFKTKKPSGRRKGPFLRDRVVVVDMPRNKAFQTLGRAIPGLPKTRPAWDRTWLLPEEALYLLERGTLDVWWPFRPIKEIFPPTSSGPQARSEGRRNDKIATDPTFSEGNYDAGLPISLQSAYSLLVGDGHDRGRISLARYQVYASLRRTGYIVMRAPPNFAAPAVTTTLPNPLPQNAQRPPPFLWRWLISLFSPLSKSRLGAPLVPRGLYRSYRPIYEKLSLSMAHRPKQDPPATSIEDPFRIAFHVWRPPGSSRGFGKANPPPPDFYVAVVDARKDYVPTLEQATGLLSTAPWDPPPPSPREGGGPIYNRLKMGYRSVVCAVVDAGVVNYLRFAEGAFAEEPLWPRFDHQVSVAKAPSGGGRGGGRGAKNPRRGRSGEGRVGRSGKGGRGRGRGR